MKLPQVSLFGRTNVGKTALFNRIAKNQIKSLVFDQKNVTRDYVEGQASFEDKKFKLIDTGGLGDMKKDCSVSNQVYQKALSVLASSQVVVFVCDISSGIQDEDIRLIKLARKTISKNTKLIVAVNKADNQIIESEIYNFSRLGVSKIYPVSALHYKGIDALLSDVVSDFPVASSDSNSSDFQGFKICVVGKPNVGKSSLVNLLLSKDRVIVADQEGTTRESVLVSSYINENLINIIDTPGVRKSSSVNDDLESLMVKSSLASVRVSDLIILVVDCSAGSLLKQDLKLLSYALEKNKSVIVVFNKIDLLNPITSESLKHDMERYNFLLKNVIKVRVCCLDKKGVAKVRSNIEKIMQKVNSQFNSEDLTFILKKKFGLSTIHRKGKILKIHSVKFEKNSSAPEISVYVNDPELFSASSVRCIENEVRRHYDLTGCPLSVKIKQAFF